MPKGIYERKLKTHCKKGHEFTPENTYHISTRNQRICLTCKRESWKWAKRSPLSRVKHWLYPTVEQLKARSKLGYAVQAGKLERGSCAVCNAPKADGHHPDYSKPLEVIWLCKKHHAEAHRKK